jgi:hypothetical protein
MTRMSRGKVYAAIGGATALCALLTGIPGAHAEEPGSAPELQVNQGLLDERINQLAQVGDGGAKAAPNAPVTGGSFPRSFVIPGTDTSIRIGGEIRLSIDHISQGGGNNINAVPTNTIGVAGLLESTPLNNGDSNHSRSHFTFFSPRESRIRIETRTPTAFGEAGTVFEFDALGGVASAQDPAQVANSLIVRMRHAYATLGGLLIGQTSNWLFDGESHAETLDFGGPPFLGPDRQPQIRYTSPLPWVGGAVWAVEFDQPDTDVHTAVGKFDSVNSVAFPGVVAFPAGVGTLNAVGGASINPAKSGLPDSILGLQFDQPWMHMRLGAVVRDLEIQDGRFIQKSYIGYGGGIQGWFSVPWSLGPLDQIQYGFGDGDGIGRQITGSTNSALDTNYGAFAITSQAAANHVIVKPISEWAGYLGYTHRWSEDVRSNLAIGQRHEDYHAALIGAAQSGVANKNLNTLHANVIWAPVAFADVGVEYLYGQRQVVNNQRGTLSSLLTRFRMRF